MLENRWNTAKSKSDAAGGGFSGARLYGDPKKSEFKLLRKAPYALEEAQSGRSFASSSEEGAGLYEQLLVSANETRIVKRSDIIKKGTEKDEFPISLVLGVHWSIVNNDFTCPVSGMFTVFTETLLKTTREDVDAKNFKAGLRKYDPTVANEYEGDRLPDVIWGPVAYSGGVARALSAQDGSFSNREDVWSWRVSTKSSNAGSLGKVEIVLGNVNGKGPSVADIFPDDGGHIVGMSARANQIFCSTFSDVTEKEIRLAKLVLESRSDIGEQRAVTKTEFNPFSTLILSTTVVNTLQNSASAIVSPTLSNKDDRKYYLRYFQAMVNLKTKHDVFYQTMQSGVRDTLREFEKVTKTRVPDSWDGDGEQTKFLFVYQTHLFKEIEDYEEKEEGGKKYNLGENKSKSGRSKNWKRLLIREFSGNNDDAERRGGAGEKKEDSFLRPGISELEFSREFGFLDSLVSASKILSTSQALLSKYVDSECNEGTSSEDGNPTLGDCYEEILPFRSRSKAEDIGEIELKNKRQLETYLGRELYDETKEMMGKVLFSRHDDSTSAAVVQAKKKFLETKARRTSKEKEMSAAPGGSPQIPTLVQELESLDDDLMVAVTSYHRALMINLLEDATLQFDVVPEIDARTEGEQMDGFKEEVWPFFKRSRTCSPLLLNACIDDVEVQTIVRDGIRKNIILSESFNGDFVSELESAFKRHDDLRLRSTLIRRDVSEILEKIGALNLVSDIKRRERSVEAYSLVFSFLSQVSTKWFSLFEAWMNRPEQKLGDVLFLHNNLGKIDAGRLGSLAGINFALTPEDAKRKTIKTALVGLASWYAMARLFLSSVGSFDRFSEETEERNGFENLVKSWLFERNPTGSVTGENPERIRKHTTEYVHSTLCYYFNTALAVLAVSPKKTVDSQIIDASLMKMRTAFSKIGSREGRVLAKKLLSSLDGFKPVEFDDSTLVDLLSKEGFAHRYGGDPYEDRSRKKTIKRSESARFLPSNGGILIKQCKTLKSPAKSTSGEPYYVVGANLGPRDRLVGNGGIGYGGNWLPYVAELPRCITPRYRFASDGTFRSKEDPSWKYDGSMRDLKNNLELYDQPTFNFRSPHEYTFLVGESVSSNPKLTEDVGGIDYGILNGNKLAVEVLPFPLEGSRFVLDGWDVLKRYRLSLLKLRKKHVRFLLERANRGYAEDNRLTQFEINIGDRISYALRVTKEALLQPRMVGVSDPSDLTTSFDGSSFRFRSKENGEKNGPSPSIYNLEWHCGTDYRGQESFVSGESCLITAYNSPISGSPDLVASGKYTLWLILDDWQSGSKYTNGSKNILNKTPLSVDYEAGVSSYLNYLEARKRGVMTISYRKALKKLRDPLEEVGNKLKEWHENMETGKLGRERTNDSTFLEAALGNFEFYDDRYDEDENHRPDLKHEVGLNTMDLSSAPSFCLMRICSVDVVKEDPKKKSRSRPEEFDASSVIDNSNKTADLIGTKENEKITRTLFSDGKDEEPTRILGKISETNDSRPSNRAFDLIAYRHSALSGKYDLRAEWIEELGRVSFEFMTGSTKRREHVSSELFFISPGSYPVNRFMAGGYELTLSRPFLGDFLLYDTGGFLPNYPDLPDNFNAPEIANRESNVRRCVFFNSFIEKGSVQAESPLTRYYKNLSVAMRAAVLSLVDFGGNDYPYDSIKSAAAATASRSLWANPEVKIFEQVAERVWQYVIIEGLVFDLLSEKNTREDSNYAAWGMTTNGYVKGVASRARHSCGSTQVLSAVIAGGDWSRAVDDVVANVPTITKSGSVRQASRNFESATRLGELDYVDSHPMRRSVRKTYGRLFYETLANGRLYLAEIARLLTVSSSLPKQIRLSELVLLRSLKGVRTFDRQSYSLYYEMWVSCKDGATGKRYACGPDYGSNSNYALLFSVPSEGQTCTKEEEEVSSKSLLLQSFADLKFGVLLRHLTKALAYRLVCKFLMNFCVEKKRLLLKEVSYSDVLTMGFDIFDSLARKYQELEDASPKSGGNEDAARSRALATSSSNGLNSSWQDRFNLYEVKGGQGSWVDAYKVSLMLALRENNELLRKAAIGGDWRDCLDFANERSGRWTNMFLDYTSLAMEEHRRLKDKVKEIPLEKLGAATWDELECESLNVVTKNFFLGCIYRAAGNILESAIQNLQARIHSLFEHNKGKTNNRPTLASYLSMPFYNIFPLLAGAMSPTKVGLDLSHVVLSNLEQHLFESKESYPAVVIYEKSQDKLACGVDYKAGRLDQSQPQVLRSWKVELKTPELKKTTSSPPPPTAEVHSILEFVKEQTRGEPMTQSNEDQLGLSEMIESMEEVWKGKTLSKYQIVLLFQGLFISRNEENVSIGDYEGSYDCSLPTSESLPSTTIIREPKTLKSKKIGELYGWLENVWIPALFYHQYLLGQDSTKSSRPNDPAFASRLSASEYAARLQKLWKDKMRSLLTE
jgi:hypothetical protein